MRILVVDDSLTIRKIVRKVLIGMGHEDVIEAPDGAQALKLVDDEVGLILVDWHMPNMTGIDFVKQMKQSRHSEIPVIMVTSERRRDEVLEAVKAGIKGYVVKPFVPEVLAERVRQVLRIAGTSGEEISPEGTGFSGNLNLTSTPEIAQFLSAGGKSGRLDVYVGGKSYRIFFENGQISAAEGPDCTDEEVVYALANVSSGTFRFTQSGGRPKRRIKRETTSILLESLRRADEAARE